MNNIAQLSPLTDPDGGGGGGDIYHPHFTQGRPTYFDVSIMNSFDPSQIINAAN